MPELTQREVMQRMKDRVKAHAAGVPTPPLVRKKQTFPAQMLALSSVPSGPISADRQALAANVVVEQAYQQAKYDTVQASLNATRPMGRRTFVPLPEFKPAQRKGHDELGFVQVRRHPAQLSQAQDKVWADAYRDGLAFFKGEKAEVEPMRPVYCVKTDSVKNPLGHFGTEEGRSDYIKRLPTDETVVEVWELNIPNITMEEAYNRKKALCHNERPSLGRNQNAAHVDLSDWKPGDRRMDVAPKLVTIASVPDMSPRPSAMIGEGSIKRLGTSVTDERFAQMRVDRIAEMDRLPRF